MNGWFCLLFCSNVLPFITKKENYSTVIIPRIDLCVWLRRNKSLCHLVLQLEEQKPRTFMAEWKANALPTAHLMSHRRPEDVIPSSWGLWGLCLSSLRHIEPQGCLVNPLNQVYFYTSGNQTCADHRSLEVNVGVLRTVKDVIFLEKRPEASYCINSVQPLSPVWLFVTLWTAAHQASLSITNSQSVLKLMSIKSVMPSNHLVLCLALLLPSSIIPSIRVFSMISSLNQVAKVLELQLQHQSFQWIFRVDCL